MTLEEIKSAVLAGKKVHWSNEGYEVVQDELDQWFIKCNQNSQCIGLTHQDGVTMNGQPADFFIAPERVVEPETIYLDLPTPELCDPDCSDDEGWVHVKRFTDPVEAVAFIREHIDPYCDDQGRINILANMPAMPNGDLPRFLAVCKEVASMPGKDWIDGQMKLARAIMEYEGELAPLHTQLAICEYHNCNPYLQRFISKTPIDIDRVGRYVVEGDSFDEDRDQLTFVDEPLLDIDLDVAEAELATKRESDAAHGLVVQIKVTQIVDALSDSDDKVDLPSGDDKLGSFSLYDVPPEHQANAESALDWFHDHVAIGNLEEFDIDCLHY